MGLRLKIGSWLRGFWRGHNKWTFPLWTLSHALPLRIISRSPRSPPSRCHSSTAQALARFWPHGGSLPNSDSSCVARHIAGRLLPFPAFPHPSDSESLISLREVTPLADPYYHLFLGRLSPLLLSPSLRSSLPFHSVSPVRIILSQFVLACTPPLHVFIMCFQACLSLPSTCLSLPPPS